MPCNTQTRQVNNNGLFDFSIPSYEKSAGAVPVTRPTHYKALALPIIVSTSNAEAPRRICITSLSK